MVRGNSQFVLGDVVSIPGHGLGIVTGIGCCGHTDKVEDTYSDGTKYHSNTLPQPRGRSTIPTAFATANVTWADVGDDDGGA